MKPKHPWGIGRVSEGRQCTSETGSIPPVLPGSQRKRAAEGNFPSSSEDHFLLVMSVKDIPQVIRFPVMKTMDRKSRLLKKGVCKYQA